MKKRSAFPESLFLFASLALAILLALAGSRLSKNGDVPASEACPPDFRLASLAGDRLGPADYPGRVVLLDFWATWCVPCRFQEKVIAEAYPELEERNVQVLAIDLGEDESTVRDYFREGLPEWPVLLDTEDRLTAELGIEALPSLMILDRQGCVSYFDVGILDEKALRAQIEHASSTG